MTAPRAVLLDVGGVLLLPDPEVVRPVLPCAPPSERVLDRAHYRALAAHETGALDWEGYFRIYARQCGVAPGLVPQAVPGLRDAFAGRVWTRVVPGARDLLATLRASGLRTAVVSNADGRLAADLRSVGLTGFDVVLDSVVVGIEKPDPRMFTTALDGLGVRAGEAVHVGDIVSADVVGALGAGVRPLHFVPFGACGRTSPGHEHLRRLADLGAVLCR